MSKTLRLLLKTFLKPVDPRPLSRSINTCTIFGWDLKGLNFALLNIVRLKRPQQSLYKPKRYVYIYLFIKMLTLWCKPNNRKPSCFFPGFWWIWSTGSKSPSWSQTCVTLFIYTLLNTSKSSSPTSSTRSTRRKTTGGYCKKTSYLCLYEKWEILSII